MSTLVLVGKEARDQRRLLVVWTLLALLPELLRLADVWVASLSAHGAGWQELLFEVGRSRAEDYRELFFVAIVFAWGGFRVFQSESEAGTRSWLRTMPLADESVVRIKALVSAAYIVAAFGIAALGRLGAVAVIGPARFEDGIVAIQLRGLFVWSATMLLWYAVGGLIGVVWDARGTTRGFLLLAGGWLLGLIVLGIAIARLTQLDSRLAGILAGYAAGQAAFVTVGVAHALLAGVVLARLAGAYASRPAVTVR